MTVAELLLRLACVPPETELVFGEGTVRWNSTSESWEVEDLRAGNSVMLIRVARDDKGAFCALFST